MNQNVESKLRGWTTMMVVIGWILAALFCVLGLVLCATGEGIFSLLICMALAADILMLSYYFARLTSAFADITENTRETAQALKLLNLNLQRVYSDDISAAERVEAEKERMEKERAEQERKEAERVAAEQRQIEHERIKKAREAATKRKEEYWNAHVQEKKALLAKREQAEKALSIGGLGAKEIEQLRTLIFRIGDELERDR